VKKTNGNIAVVAKKPSENSCFVAVVDVQRGRFAPSCFVIRRISANSADSILRFHEKVEPLLVDSVLGQFSVSRLPRPLRCKQRGVRFTSHPGLLVDFFLVQLIVILMPSPALGAMCYVVFFGFFLEVSRVFQPTLPVLCCKLSPVARIPQVGKATLPRPILEVILSSISLLVRHSRIIFMSC